MTLKYPQNPKTPKPQNPFSKSMCVSNFVWVSMAHSYGIKNLCKLHKWLQNNPEQNIIKQMFTSTLCDRRHTCEQKQCVNLMANYVSIVLVKRVHSTWPPNRAENTPLCERSFQVHLPSLCSSAINKNVVNFSLIMNFRIKGQIKLHFSC